MTTLPPLIYLLFISGHAFLRHTLNQPLVYILCSSLWGVQKPNCSAESTNPQIPHPVTACAVCNYKLLKQTFLWANSCFFFFFFFHASHSFTLSSNSLQVQRFKKPMQVVSVRGTAAAAGLITCVTSLLSPTFSAGPFSNSLSQLRRQGLVPGFVFVFRIFLSGNFLITAGTGGS